MSQNQARQAKQILLNPVVQFCEQYPDADAEKKSRLGELWNQAKTLKKQNEDIQVQTKILSRKIGEAKKNNLTTDDLMHTMQVQSMECKRLKLELKDIEKQILSFFVDRNVKEISNTKSKSSSSGSRYASSSSSLDKITISLLDKEDSAWNDYVEKHPAATIHHLTQWRDILQKAYGIESFNFYAQDDQQKIVGVLPLARLRSRMFGDLMVSMPYFQRGGAIADHPFIEKALMQAANKKAAQLGIGHIEYRDDIPRENLLVQSHKVNMVLTLPDSEDALWNSFTAKLRAQIKRPQQLAPQIFIGGKEYLDDFYKVYSRNMRDLGSPVHSRRLVQNILNDFPENSWIIVIRMNNSPVSAGLLLGYGKTMEIPLASTIREANPHSMNMLLYWEVLKHAVKEGYSCFDFGRSSKGAGTYRFKKQWGAQPKQLHWHYWLSESGELPSLNPSNPKYALIINSWKRLPVMLTRWLGPLIVKNIP